MRIAPLLSLAAALLCSVAYGADPEQTLRRSASGDAATLDPHLWVDGWEGNIVQDLFTGLTTLDAKVNVVPGCAESWSISEDGLTYTFALREALKWSDGAPLTAQDFVYSFRRILDPETAAPSAALLYLIKNAEAVNRGRLSVEALGVTAPDDRTLIIELVEPAPYFPELIVHRGLPAPRHVIERKTRGWTQPGTMVSNGAFVLDEWIPQNHVRLVRNPEFFDADAVKLEVMYHVPSEDQETGLRRYRAGELDLLTTLPPARLGWIKENLSDQLQLIPILGLDYYIFNTEKAPLDNLSVRRALSMAIEREVLTQRITLAGEEPAYGLVPPGVLNYREPGRLDYEGRASAARRNEAAALLAEAGFGPNNPLRLTLRYNTNETHKRVAVAIAAMWKPLGVQLELVNSEQKVLLADIRNGDFEIARASWFAEVRDAMTYLELLHSGSGKINQSRFVDPAYDELVDAARQAVDLDARAELMRRAEIYGLSAHALVPINFYVGRRLVKPYVRGWEPNPRGIHLARYLSVER